MRRASHQGRESRLRILDAALLLGSERGYDAATIGLLSERTGLAASSIYWHFKNKEELLAAAMEHGIAQLPVDLEADPGTPYDELLRERLAAAVRTVTSRPEVWRFGLMLALERRAEEPEARSLFVGLHQRLTDALEQWWVAVLPVEVSDPGLARRLATFHLAVVDGFHMVHAGDEGWDLERLGSLVAAGLVTQVEACRTGLR